MGSIEARNRPLAEWMTRIRTHQIVLPRFQRFEAWSHSNVRQLFNTILQGLPVGAVLVLEIGAEEPFVARPLVGAPDRGERVTEHLLDGQQRLTALWRGLNNNYPDRTYFLFAKPDDESGLEFFIDSVARWTQKDDAERRPFWANRPSEQWKRRMIPLDLLAPGDATPAAFERWLGDLPDDAERLAARTVYWRARERFTTFNLPFLSLPSTTKPDTALSVFIRMNTSASPLSTYDILVAQVEAGMDQSLHDLVAGTIEKCPRIADYYAPADLALSAGALLQDRPPTNASFMLKDFGKGLLEQWNLYVNGLSRAADFLEEERVFDEARLPTDVVVPVLVAFWALAPKGGDGEGRARTLAKRYLWRAFFSDRYERATGTRSLEDFRALKAVLKEPGARNAAVLDDALHPLPQLEELMSAGWPKKKDRLGRAILALSLRHGGLDLADGSTVSRSNLAKREYHHLFPEAHLRRSGINDDDRIYNALNCALVTWTTNRTISAKQPERYLAERLDGASLGQDDVRARLSSHLIPYTEMIQGDYGAFLASRAALVHRAMTDVCEGRTT